MYESNILTENNYTVWTKLTTKIEGADQNRQVGGEFVHERRNYVG
jgi:hypothetical protein